MLTAYDIFYNNAEQYYREYEKYRYLFGYKKVQDIQKELFDLLIEVFRKSTEEKKRVNLKPYLEAIEGILIPSKDFYTISNNPFTNVLREVEYKQVLHKKDYLKMFEEAECQYIDKECQVDVIVLFSKVKSNEKVDQSEFNQICHLAAIGYSDFSDEDTFEYIFRMIIDHGYVVEKYDYHSIMKRFCMYVCKETGLDPILVNVRNRKKCAADYGPFSLDEIGKNVDNKEINLSTTNLDYEHIMDNINTIFHEISHGHQILQFKKNSHMTLSLIKDLYLREKFGKEFYDENYWNISYEVNARRLSAYRTIEFLKHITKTGASKYKEEYLREIRNAQKNNDRNLKRDDELFYSDIDSLFREYIKEIAEDEKMWSIIGQEYNKNGKRKQIIEFLMKRNMGNKRFYDALIYDHDYTIEEIKDNLFSLRLYMGINAEERKEMTEKLPIKLLEDLNKQIRISGLNSTKYDKKTVELIKRNLKSMAKRSQKFKLVFEDSDSQELEHGKRR